jgi:hypothetical protein
VAGLRSAGDDQFQGQLRKLADAVADLPVAYSDHRIWAKAKQRTWDNALDRVNEEIGAVAQEVDRLTKP